MSAVSEMLHFKVFMSEYNLAVKLKIHLLLDVCLCEILCSFPCDELSLEFVQAF
jgi:hypothetical protein